jgi:hypothetical protein
VGSEACVEEPLLALVRDGDRAEDLNDAIGHLARCPGCRARLTEGTIGRKRFVVVAIEAPTARRPDLEKALSSKNARLFERGPGRFTAVVDADQVEAFKSQIEKAKSSVVNRLAVGTPFEVPVEDLRAARTDSRQKLDSIIPLESGTDAAEVQAWVQVAMKPRKRVSSFSPSWILVAFVAIAGAMVLAYLLATHLGSG